MITLKQLYNIAEDNNIPIIDYPIHNDRVGALSVCDEDGDSIIALDVHKLNGSADHKVKIAHELGHCVLGAFYNQYSSYDARGKHEYRADKWAIQEVMPYDELICACKNGYTTSWQLAEYFGVTEDFVYRAFEIYRNMGYNFE